MNVGERAVPFSSWLNLSLIFCNWLFGFLLIILYLQDNVLRQINNSKTNCATDTQLDGDSRIVEIAKWILRYVKETMSYELLYTKHLNNEKVLVSFVDANYATD